VPLLLFIASEKVIEPEPPRRLFVGGRWEAKLLSISLGTAKTDS
jgi:hypothetical protein